MSISKTSVHRKDIDGLRAISVVSVILFHFGGLKNGYLGVDVFFVISGYLITKIIYLKIQDNSFDILDFYLRRTRRIIPLVLFVNIVVLCIGLLVMLPDDLENLCQSIIATNFFANNILQLITTKNYWHVVNEYKPLMHTWSLAIEEQFYLIFPFIFVVLKKRLRWILPVLSVVSLISITLLLLEFRNACSFYLIQYRFFELCFGGIMSILFLNKFQSIKNLKLLLTLLLCSLLVIDIPIPSQFKTILVIILAGFFLILEDRSRVFNLLVENRIMSAIGLISFSLYMWHQPVLAYSRYIFVEKISLLNSLLIISLIFVLSILSYLLIEQPFRDVKRITTKRVLIFCFIFSIFTSLVSAIVYFRSGVIKDYPELDLSKDNTSRNLHAQYNDRIYNFNLNFKKLDKVKVLVLGNSFARDWANLLLESKYKDSINISYIHEYVSDSSFADKYLSADKIFISDIDKDTLHEILLNKKLDTTKYYIIGIKYFGTNNGLYYNHNKDNQFCLQKVRPDSAFISLNQKFKQQYNNRYIDLYEFSKDSQGMISIFTNECKFISQDCYHFTKSGAKYFSQKLSLKLDSIFQ
jgi:peptidoglycan/LPS O-acetylase OafA/YrhL